MDTETATALTSHQANMWCEERSIRPSGFGSHSLGGPSPYRFSLEQPPAALVALTDRILPVGWPDEAERACLIWVQQREVWAEHSEEVGFLMWSKLAWKQADAVMFSASSGREAQAAMLCPIMFGWDALIVPEGAEWFLSVHHDGTATVCAERPKVRDRVLERLDRTVIPQANGS